MTTRSKVAAIALTLHLAVGASACNDSGLQTVGTTVSASTANVSAPKVVSPTVDAGTTPAPTTTTTQVAAAITRTPIENRSYETFSASIRKITLPAD